MESYQNDINQLEQDAKMEDIYYILLSLCREYSLEMMNGSITQEDCYSKLKMIKNDMKQLDKQELMNKTKQIYQPILKKLKKKHYDA